MSDPKTTPVTKTPAAAAGSEAGSEMNAAEMTSHAPGASAAKTDKSVRDMADETAEAAKSRASQLGDKAKAEARDLGDQARNMAEAKVDEAKGYATAEIDRQADSIRAAGREFGEDSYQAQAADYLASNLTHAADVIRSKDLGTMVDDLSMFARRNPGLFLGGAAVLGFAAARLLKATERPSYRSDYPGGYGAEDFDAPQPGVRNTYHDGPAATPVRSTPAPVPAAAPVTQPVGGVTK